MGGEGGKWEVWGVWGVEMGGGSERAYCVTHSPLLPTLPELHNWVTFKSFINAPQLFQRMHWFSLTDINLDDYLRNILF